MLKKAYNTFVGQLYCGKSGDFCAISSLFHNERGYLLTYRFSNSPLSAIVADFDVFDPK